MPLIIATGKIVNTVSSDRCARCRRKFKPGEKALGVQIHYTYKTDYNWGSVHHPRCHTKEEV